MYVSAARDSQCVLKLVFAPGRQPAECGCDIVCASRDYVEFGSIFRRTGEVMHRTAAVLLAAFLLGLIVHPQAFSQVVTATLTGSVTDSSGASVPNATVKVTEQSTGIVRSTSTSVDGVYNVAYLNPGVYRLEVDATGFKKYSQENVRIALRSQKTSARRPWQNCLSRTVISRRC
jgi:hypothetical protein